jgi:8-oxo-dGTP pyrophosphatase MutT (NUDIX family)
MSNSTSPPSPQLSPGVRALMDRIKEKIRENPGKVFTGAPYDNLPSAAVLMLLRPEGNSLEALLVKRKVSEGDPWSGHMAFPGGRSSKTDSSIEETVTREAFEETGIRAGEDYEIIGTLDQVVPGNISIKVTPFVAFAIKDVSVRIDGNEIVEYFWIPIAFFANKGNSSTYKLLRFGKSYEVPSFAYMGKHIVWGMTLRIIENFIEKLGSDALA